MGGGGVQRWLKFTKYLREYGWEPIIFTAEDAELSLPDESLLKQIPDGIETLRAPIWEPFDLYKKLLGKKKDEKVQPGLLRQSDSKSFMYELTLWVRGNVFIPDAKMFWKKPAIKVLSEYLKEHKIDAIVSTGPPHTTHMIAKSIKRKLNIPWLADFRDPWTNVDFYHKLKLSKWADKRHHKLEKSVLREADQTITVTWSWADDFNKMGEKKVEVVTNGYDPADFENNDQYTLSEKFKITHIGSMNADRNPPVLWEVLADLSKEVEGFKNDLVVSLIGPVDFSVFELAKLSGLEENVQHTKHIPHSEVIGELCQSQALLLPLNNTPNIDGVAPGKLFEYIGAKRPIICIGKPTGDAAKIIKETKAGSMTDFTDREGLKAQLLKMYNDYKNNSLTINSTGAENYSRKKLAGDIANYLNKITQ